MQRYELESLFHAELDVMVFDLKDVAKACNEHGSGIFAVADAPGRALASLFYVNSASKFDHFLSFAISRAHMRNEMEVIGSYLQLHPQNGHALPAHPVFNPGRQSPAPSTLPSDRGLFDANAFGQWLFGVDPRNVGLMVKNHFKNETVLFSIHRLQFTIPLFGRDLVVRQSYDQAFRLRTLHVHSKIVKRLTYRPILHFYLLVNNWPLRWVVIRKKGWAHERILRLALRGRGFLLVRAIHTITPGLIEAWILALATHSALPLSIRQRRMVLALLARSRRYRAAQIQVPVLTIEQRRPVESNRAQERVGRQGGVNREAQTANHLSVEVVFGVEEALSHLLESSREALLVMTPEGRCLPQQSTDGAGRQALVVTSQRFDSDWPLVTAQWGEDLDTSLCFSHTAQLMQPDWVREMFPGGRDEVRTWLSSSNRICWRVVAQAYGAWARTHRARFVFLVGREEPPQ